MATFFQMMAMHPDVVKRAHAEIDRATHKERLPTLEDRKGIPIVDCIMKEVFRSVVISFYYIIIFSSAMQDPCSCSSRYALCDPS